MGTHHRFFCPQLVPSGSVSLIETEAHHLAHVLRHQSGDLVELFNGDGLAATCRIRAVRKRDVELEVVDSKQDPQQITSLTIATAVPKGDRFEWLIEKATELGVSRIIPLTTLRSVVDPRNSKLDKLRQTVVTACKQSGRNRLMTIESVTSWNDFVQEIIPSHRILIAHPQGESLDTATKPSESETRPIAIAIGPEGGFSDEEIQSAVAKGAWTVHLGQNILRIETAAIALAAKILL